MPSGITLNSLSSESQALHVILIYTSFVYAWVDMSQIVVYNIIMKLICGIDEVGRGCLAGPVLASCVILGEGASKYNDSKKLTHLKRVKLFSSIRKEALYSNSIYRTADQIDQSNILASTLDCFSDLMTGATSFVSEYYPDAELEFLIDGNRLPKDAPDNASFVVKGDGKINSISAASILAKVTRDRWMDKLSVKHPGYGLEKHKGYGTKQHILALKELGPIPGLHRYTFAPIRC